MNREDLRNYKYTQKWIKMQLEKYEEQRAVAFNISQILDGLPHAKNKTNYNLENLIDKYDEMIEILKEDQEKQNQIIKEIKKIEEPYRTILLNKYIFNMSLEEISVNIGYAYENVCRMHGTALNKFDNLESHQ